MVTIKFFDIETASWFDVTGQNGTTIEYSDETSGWISVNPKYKKYVAQLSQSGTDAPIPIVFENTLGFIPNWQYDSAGVYGFNWNGDFVSDKSINYLSPTHNGKLIWIDYDDIYDITLKSYDGDDIITKITIEIRYYN